MDIYAQSEIHTWTRKILVVDDEPVIRDMMVDILELEGYAIEVARNGHEALEKLLHAHPEDGYLIFLDMMMPVMDGRTFCERLNANPALRRRQVIVLMSALDQLSSVTTLRADAIMPKPFVIDDALALIQKLLQSQLI
ncbi:MAG: hypothetical protein NVS2B12_25160 [Ktedonobacteraceae bacterium]